jgi:hypothetical protein
MSGMRCDEVECNFKRGINKRSSDEIEEERREPSNRIAGHVLVSQILQGIFHMLYQN